jgi:hypothetical protein
MKIPVDKIQEFISGPPISDDLEEAVLFAHHNAAGAAFLIAGRNAIELAQEFADEGSDGVFCEILGHIDTLLESYKS